MKKNSSAPNEDPHRSLRQRAERILHYLHRTPNLPEAADLAEIIQELTIHQIELEMQGRELRESQQKLLEARELYFQHFANAPIPVMFFNRDGSIEDFNLQAAALLDLHGTRNHPVPAVVFEKLLPRPDLTLFRKFLADCFHNLGHQDLVLPSLALRGAEGREQHFSVTCRLLSRKHSHVAALYFQDVTASWQQQQEFARLALIAEHTRNGVLFTDAQQRIVWANRAFTQISGYTLEEVRGKNPRFLQGPDTDRETKGRMRRALLNKQGFHEEILNYHKNGRRYWIDIECIPIEEKGEIVGYIAVQSDITARVDRERELRNFHTAIEQSPLAVVITDPTGKIEFVNPAFEAITQYTPAEAIGQNPRILKSGMQPQSFYEKMWQTISSGKVWKGTLQNKRKDGTLYWESASIAPVLDHRGNISRYIAVKEDITASYSGREELNRTVVELQKTKEFLEQTERVSRVGGWEVTLNPMRLFHSTVVREIHEVEPGTELSMEDAINFYREGEDRERIRAAAYRCLEEGVPFDVECRFVTARGREIWVRAIGQPRMEDGRIVGMFGTFQDITEQKNLRERLEVLLQEEKRQLRFIYDLTQALPVAIFTKDLQGRYIQCNPAFLALHKLSADQVLGHTSAEVFPGPDGEQLHRYDMELMAKEAGPFQYETMALSTHVPVLTTKSVFHDDGGRVAGLVGALTDISKIKELEENLRQAKIEADASNRAKSAFLATMSHEIRTPLNAVIGMASLLEELTFDAQQREYAHTIVTASETLLALINDILDYSKIESRRLEIHAEEFVFEDCFLEPVEWFSREAMEKNIEVTHYLDPAVPKMVYGDKLRLRQILMNLLSNAVKFTEAGQVSVEVRLGQPSQPLEPLDGRPAVRLDFRVQDTGIGIAPEAQKRLFHPFSQADSSITRQYGGSGLGLAITRRLVELMGGYISLESEPGVGTTFVFSLPFGVGQTPAKPTPPEPSLQGRNVLVVDDVQVNRELIEAFGSRWGIHVQSAASAAEARRLLQNGATFDFIILDYQMPVEDGATLARSLVADPNWKNIPRLLLSSVTEPAETFEKGLFELVLHKPLRPSKLKSHLLRLLSQRPLPRLGTPAAGPSLAASQKVLLAEDNPNNQTVLRLMMKKLGCEFTIVENGALAVEAALQNSYDIILLDVQMPVMDGLTAVAKIRQHFADKPNRPYLVSLTANAFAEDQKACLAAGFDFYLAKPVTLRQLEDVMVRRPTEAAS